MVAVSVWFGWVVFYFRYSGTRGSPAMTTRPRLGGELCVGDGNKRGRTRKRNERKKTSSCHGPVGPESSWINIKDIKQTKTIEP